MVDLTLISRQLTMDLPVSPLLPRLKGKKINKLKRYIVHVHDQSKGCYTNG